jgi:hypothetical protein
MIEQIQPAQIVVSGPCVIAHLFGEISDIAQIIYSGGIADAEHLAGMELTCLDYFSQS